MFYETYGPHNMRKPKPDTISVIKTCDYFSSPGSGI